jgi:hypothetical protein
MACVDDSFPTFPTLSVSYQVQGKTSLKPLCFLHVTNRDCWFHNLEGLCFFGKMLFVAFSEICSHGPSLSHFHIPTFTNVGISKAVIWRFIVLFILLKIEFWSAYIYMLTSVKSKQWKYNICFAPFLSV